MIFRQTAYVTVVPTERGIQKVEENHPYYASIPSCNNSVYLFSSQSFKYLFQKPIAEMFKSAQFLHILAAEKEHLIEIIMSIPSDIKAAFERKLTDAFSSNHFTDSAKAWNSERSLVVQEALEQHLMPSGMKWVREMLKDSVEDYVAGVCRERLQAVSDLQILRLDVDVYQQRLDVAPFVTRELKYGESACSVLAISWGKGDHHKDTIVVVFVDEAGRLRDHTKLDNLYDQDNRDELIDLLKRRKPDVAVVGGFSIATLKLMNLVKSLFQGTNISGQDDGWGNNTQAFDIPIIYVQDDIARIYQHSKRAAEEFSALSSIAKYCVGLARYAQSPLNEFAALGPDITAISFDEENQHHVGILRISPTTTLNFGQVPKEKLLVAFEQALVDVTNKVGVEINRAVTDPYYQHLLRFVCGLGPRKAEMLVKKIVSQVYKSMMFAWYIAY